MYLYNVYLFLLQVITISFDENISLCEAETQTEGAAAVENHHDDCKVETPWCHMMLKDKSFPVSFSVHRSLLRLGGLQIWFNNWLLKSANHLTSNSVLTSLTMRNASPKRNDHPHHLLFHSVPLPPPHLFHNNFRLYQDGHQLYQSVLHSLQPPLRQTKKTARLR